MKWVLLLLGLLFITGPVLSYWGDVDSDGDGLTDDVDDDDDNDGLLDNEDDDDDGDGIPDDEEDRHPDQRHPREQNRLWQPQDPRPLAARCNMSIDY